MTDIQHLIDRYLEGSCSRAELEELLERISEHQDTHTLDDILRQHWAKTDPDTITDARQARWDGLYTAMMKEAGHRRKQPKRITWWAAAAAMLVLIAGAATYKMWHTRQENA